MLMAGESTAARMQSILHASLRFSWATINRPLHYKADDERSINKVLY